MIERMHPRMADAQALVRDGAVTPDAEGAWVRGREAEYRVRRDDGGEWRCSCPWAGRHGATRGPCKHIVAVQIANGENAGYDE
jgi:uncharacterized Zn finger protein